MIAGSGRRDCFVFRIFSRDTVMDDHKLPLMMKHLILKIWSSYFMLLLFSVYHLVSYQYKSTAPVFYLSLLPILRHARKSEILFSLFLSPIYQSICTSHISFCLERGPFKFLPIFTKCFLFCTYNTQNP